METTIKNGAEVCETSTPGNDLQQRYKDTKKPFDLNSLHEEMKGSESKSANAILLEQAKVNPDDELQDAPVCLEFVGRDDAAIVGTFGNFLAIIGKAKSRKTFLVSLIVAAFLAGRVLMRKIKTTLPENKNRVLYFDTEQSRYHLQKVLKRILATAEIPAAPYFEAFCLRTFPPTKRLELMTEKIRSCPDTGVVIIDGIRDVVLDINDATEATNVVTALMQLSEELGIHIIVVIHQNKNDNNARGHLGTEIINKAESVLSVTKDSQHPDFSIVEAERCREKDFEPFTFKVTEQGLPLIDDDFIKTSDSEGRKRQILPHEIGRDVHLEVLQEVFKATPRPKYSQLQTGIITAFQRYKVVFGNSKAEQFISYYKKESMITENEDKRPGERCVTYCFHVP
jgi:hypothetical protein